MALSPILPTGVTQERAGTPSTCTVQAPQSAMPQPNLVPDIPSTSRSTQRSGVSASTSTLCAVPFTTSFMTDPDPARRPVTWALRKSCALRLLAFGLSFVQCIVRMSAIREVHLRDVDLNLLHALRALLEERHVTRAAKRCFVSQPAMSRALERLREMFGDVLLVRSGRAYERTVRGERVLRELESLMPRLEAMVRGESFEPEGSHERFRVAMTDHAAAMLMPPLLRRVRAAATNVEVEVSMWHSHVYEDVTAGRTSSFAWPAGGTASRETGIGVGGGFYFLSRGARWGGLRALKRVL